jgi:hypothetical protein
MRQPARALTVSDGRYRWVAFCEKQFGDVPSEICSEGDPRRRRRGSITARRARRVQTRFVVGPGRNWLNLWTTDMPPIDPG